MTESIGIRYVILRITLSSEMSNQSDVQSHSDGYWENFNSQEERDYEITGKYLFFSTDRELLVNIAKNEISKGPFHRAKTQMPGANDVIPGTGDDYVLCLYYKDNSKKHELADKYQERENLKYRYWKSNEATRRGEYSEEFLEDMPLRIRDAFTSSGGDNDKEE